MNAQLLGWCMGEKGQGWLMQRLPMRESTLDLYEEEQEAGDMFDFTPRKPPTLVSLRVCGDIKRAVNRGVLSIQTMWGIATRDHPFPQLASLKDKHVFDNKNDVKNCMALLSYTEVCQCILKFSTLFNTCWHQHTALRLRLGVRLPSFGRAHRWAADEVPRQRHVQPIPRKQARPHAARDREHGVGCIQEECSKNRERPQMDCATHSHGHHLADDGHSF